MEANTFCQLKFWGGGGQMERESREAKFNFSWGENPLPPISFVVCGIKKVPKSLSQMEVQGRGIWEMGRKFTERWNVHTGYYVMDKQLHKKWAREAPY